jgi:hypothetical protein
MLISELVAQLNEMALREGNVPVMIWHRKGSSTNIHLYIDKYDLNLEDRDEKTVIMLDAGDCF